MMNSKIYGKLAVTNLKIIRKVIFHIFWHLHFL